MSEAERPAASSPAKAKSRPTVLSRSAWRIRGLFWGAVFLLAAIGPLACRLLADWLWLFELGVHFMIPSACAAVLACVLFAACRAWPGLAAAVVVAALSAFQLWPYLGTSFNTPAPNGPAVRFLTANVLTSNDRYSDFDHLLATTDPDVAAVLEIDQAWADHLQTLSDVYPHQRLIPQRDNFGIAILSKWPLTDPSASIMYESYPPMLDVLLASPHGDIRVMAAHTVPPVNAMQASFRNEQLDNLAFAAADIDAPLVVLGDLNVTMWSPKFQDFLRRGRLRDARLGRGLLPTWPAHWRFLGLPIDHCLYSGALSAAELSAHTIPGSDHRALAGALVLEPRD